MSTTSPLRRRLASLAVAASVVALPLGVGAVAVAGAAQAAEPKTVHAADGRAVDALGGRHSDGFGADGSYDANQHLVWLIAGERFREESGDDCNPYTFIYGGVQSDPQCPIGQVESAWNVDFVKQALQQSGFRTDDIVNEDLTTLWSLGTVTPYFQHDDPSNDYVPAGGDLMLLTDDSGEDGAVAVVLDAKSASKVKVAIGDAGTRHDRIVTLWVDPATFTFGGHPVTSYVTPFYG